MGFQYRRQKRETAHWLIGILANYTLHEKRIKDHNNENYLLKHYGSLTIREIQERHQSKNIITLLKAAKLLETNKHITFKNDNTDVFMSELSATEEGEEAYDEGFHLREIDKDRLEKFETISKRVLPVVSLFISLFALGASLSNGCKKQPEMKILPQTIILEKDTSKPNKTK